jgi:transcriptional regulator GlxA family with amidase domain
MSILEWTNPYFDRGKISVERLNCPNEVEAVASKRTQRYQDIVARFEAIARTNLAKPNGVAALRKIASVNQRTLARAFQAIHASTPSRYLYLLRLSEARKALLSKKPLAQTVTQVAMKFGFRELGRFAIDYRAEFGESPSETLRRSSTSVSATEVDELDARGVCHIL